MKKVSFFSIGVFLLLISGAFYWFNFTNKPSVEEQKVTQLAESPEIKPLSAVLEIFTGTVSIVLPGTNVLQTAVNGEKITEGTKIITGEKARAQLLFPNQSVTRLDDKTEITLKKLTENPTEIEILLEKRRIWNRVAKLLGGDSFRSTTPTVVATVRGTSFGHGILPDGRNRIISRLGSVETHCINESQDAEVVANKKILLDCTSGGTLPLLDLDEQIKDKDEWYEFNIKQDNELDTRFDPGTYDDEMVSSSPSN